MRMLSLSAATLVLTLVAGPCSSTDRLRHAETISEGVLRIASARLYSDILERACSNGWRYPRTQVESGFKRHFEELKLRLVAQGYTIAPDVIAGNPSRVPSETDFVVKRRLASSPLAACFGLYRLDNPHGL